MPRKPSCSSIVRDLRRQNLKLTQTQLAERLAVKTVTIKKIENGSLQISRRLALALAGLTGANYQAILDNDRSKLNGAFKAKSLGQLDKQVRNATDEKLSVFQNRISKGAGDLLHAARDYAPTKLVSLIAALYSGMDDLAEEFELKKALKQVQKEPPYKIEVKCPLCDCLHDYEPDWLLSALEYGPVGFECPNGHQLEFRRSERRGSRGESARKQ